MKLSREELVNLYQSVEMAISTLRLSLDLSPERAGKKMKVLRKLQVKIRSELSYIERFGEEDL